MTGARKAANGRNGSVEGMACTSGRASGA
jgi:hypothetical protein